MLDASLLISLFTPLYGIAQYLEMKLPDEEKKEFVRKLNFRLFDRNIPSSTDGVFKVVFDSMDSLFSKIFGSKFFSVRYVLSSFLITIFFLVINLIVWISLLPPDRNPISTLFGNISSVSVVLLLTLFTLLAGLASIVQTRFFLTIFRIHPTGGKFITLVYCDLVLTATLFVLICSPALALSMFIVDQGFDKAIPLSVDFEEQVRSEFKWRVTQNVIKFEWPYVTSDMYKRYDLPLENVSHYNVQESSFSTTGTADEFLENYFRNFKNIKIKKLDQEHFWPTGCSQEAEGINKCFNYNYVLYIRPFFDIGGFLRVFGNVLGTAANTLLITIVATVSYFYVGAFYFVPDQFYRIIYPLMDDRIGDMAATIMINSNPIINVQIPLTPFFLTTFLISLVVYLSAIGFKLLTFFNEILNRGLGRVKFRISERVPFLQMAVFITVVTLLVLSIHAAVYFIISTQRS